MFEFNQSNHSEKSDQSEESEEFKKLKKLLGEPENNKIQLTFEINQEVFSAIIGLGTEILKFGNSMIEYYDKQEPTFYNTAQIQMWTRFLTHMKILTGVYILGDADLSEKGLKRIPFAKVKNYQPRKITVNTRYGEVSIQN